MKFFFALAVFCCMGNALAQQGTLSGKKLILSNGSKTVTLIPAAVTTTYTFKLPTRVASGIQYLYNDGTGNCAWAIPFNSASGGGTALYDVADSQSFTSITSPANAIFNVGYALANTGSAVGALITVSANGPSGTSLFGLLDTARNIYTAQIVQSIANTPCEIGLYDTATIRSTATGTTIGIKVSATGGGNNYAAITNAGLVGIRNSAPTDTLDVTGNILISGQNGLKIVEGSNATMGIAVLGDVGGLAKVVVATTAVTATSRIYLTAQNDGGNAANMGMPYVATRTAGTSFTIQSINAAARPTVAWIIIEP